MKGIVTGLVILLCAATATGGSGRCTLTLAIKTIEKQPLFIAVYKDTSSFLNLDQALFKARYLYSEESQYVIPPLSEGEYALSVFQDKNNNGRLDASFLGVPKEPYGFSNNATGTFGPPTFAQCKFTISEDMTMEIILK